MFADRAKIYVRSGKGGDGHVSFRREKYVPDGGPDGGDGGKGGDVILMTDTGKNTLVDFRHVRKYVAENGEDGGKRNCRGKNGKDIILKVPEGTVVKEFNTGKVIVDMSGDTKKFVLLKGGRGGNGNRGGTGFRGRRSGCRGRCRSGIGRRGRNRRTRAFRRRAGSYDRGGSGYA